MEFEPTKRPRGIKYSPNLYGFQVSGMRYGASSKLPPEKVIAKAKAYFSKLGLTVVSEDQGSVCMEGGGGRVTVTTCGEKEYDVDIVTTEWDRQVKQFIQMISG
jgi:hypothetical protein